MPVTARSRPPPRPTRAGRGRRAGRSPARADMRAPWRLCEWLPSARRLAARGIWVFAFDFRGHGFSKGRAEYGRLATDYAAAVKAARALGAKNVVLAGASLGGIAAVVAGASIEPAVAGIVAVSAPAAIAGRIDAGPFAPRLQVPALYVAALEDQNEPYDFAADAQRLHDATGSMAKRLELVAGADHGVQLVERSAVVRALPRAVRPGPALSSRCVTRTRRQRGASGKVEALRPAQPRAARPRTGLPPWPRSAKRRCPREIARGGS
jgi:pimeloyl-ACP methyl ester carboxylesterase